MIKFVPILLSVFCSFSILHAKISDHYKKIENKTEGHSYGCIDFVYLINLDHRPEKYLQTLEEIQGYGVTPFRFSAVNGWVLTHSAIQEIGMQYKHSMRGGGMGSVYVWDDGKEYVNHELIRREGVTYFCHCMSRGAIGCFMSHLSILKDAYDSGYEIIWIIEDDIEVKRDPSLLLSYIQELDSVVGRENWDLFYTDRDYLAHSGEYVLSSGTDYRPDVETRDQKKFDIDEKISHNLRQTSSRFGTTSMIWTRSGMKKYLDYNEEHGIFLPIDMDVHLTPGIKIYSVIENVVTNRLNALSDIGLNIVAEPINP